MALNIILSQKTNRHIVKKLNSSYLYDSHFGTFETAKTDNTGLNHPISIAADSSNNIYICDSDNSRIVKLDSSLAFVSSLDFSSLGKPYCILFDSTSGDLYVVGVNRDLYISIAKISTALVILKSNADIYTEAEEKPYNICRGFGANDFIIAVGPNLIKVTETVNSVFTATTAVVSETIVATSHDALVKEKKYTLINSSITSYTLWKRYTETPTKINLTTFQTLHFPVLDSPGVNPNLNYVVYKNSVELDCVVTLSDPNDYTIDVLTGLITLQKAVISTDVILIRYRFEMIDTVDYALNIHTAALNLATGVSEDFNGNTDKITIDYSYATRAVIQPIAGISTAFYTGAIKHSNGDIYVVRNTPIDSAEISRINSSYTKTGDTDKISKFVIGLSEALDGSLLCYDTDNEKLVRYSEIQNYVEDVYIDNGTVDDPPATVTPGVSYQLSTFPIVDASERVYVASVLQQRTAYTLNLSNGLLTFSPSISGAVKVTYRCVNDSVQLDSYETSGILELNI